MQTIQSTTNNREQHNRTQNDQVHIGHLNSKFSTIKEVHRGCTGIKEWSWFYQDFIFSLEQKSEIQRKNMEAQIQAHNVIDKLLLCLLMIVNSATTKKFGPFWRANEKRKDQEIPNSKNIVLISIGAELFQSVNVRSLMTEFHFLPFFPSVDIWAWCWALRCWNACISASYRVLLSSIFFFSSACFFFRASNLSCNCNAKMIKACNHNSFLNICTGNFRPTMYITKEKV